MKIHILFFALALTVPLIGAISGTAVPKSGTIVFRDGFETGKTAWNLPKPFRIEPGAGRNLTGGLTFSRQTAGEPYRVASRRLKFTPGVQYRVSLWYKLEEPRPIKKGKSRRNIDFFGINFSRSGKYVGGRYLHLPWPKKPGEWQRAEFEFSPPADTSATLQLYLNRNLLGKLTIDDLSIQVAGAQKPELHITSPHTMRLPADGVYKFKLNSGEPENNLLLRGELNGVSADSKISGGTAKLSFPPVSTAEATLKTRIINRKTGKTIGEYRFEFFHPQPPAPANAAILNSAGVLEMGGRKFFPVGLVTSCLTEADIVRIGASGFNSVLRYAPFSARRAPYRYVGGPSATAALKRTLDLMEEHRLKMIFSIYEQRPGKSAELKFDHISGMDAVTIHGIETFKHHPALLAWYVSDENPIDELPAIRHLRKLAAKRDPFHPAVTLTHRIEDYFAFGSTGDIFMIDNYPIQNNRSRSMAPIKRHMDAAKRIGLPIWIAVQAFNWGWFHDTASSSGYRMPTAAEMRSMALRGVNLGATGVFFYSYSGIFKLAPRKDPNVDPEKLWQSIIAAAAPLVEYQAFFSSAAAEKVNIQTRSGSPDAKAYVFNGGKIVVLTADGPGKSELEFTLPGPEMKSKYGLTTCLGGGRYRFRATDIASDILY